MAYKHCLAIGFFGMIWSFGSFTAVMAETPAEKPAAVEVTYPPALPGGEETVTDTSADFLKPPDTLKGDFTIAKTPPTIDFMYYPGQTYPGSPWSNWGDSVVAKGKYYASIGDHIKISKGGGGGNAFVYEYDPETKKLRRLVDIKKLLNLPEGHYTPGKVHGRVDMGKDGWLYYSTYRSSSSDTKDEYHYDGDWIVRTHPKTGQSEVIARSPIAKHGVSGTMLDPDRLILFGATRAGNSEETKLPDEIQFFAYDLQAKKLLYSGPKTIKEHIMLAQSTGKAYYVQGMGEETALMRYDPAQGGPSVKIAGPVPVMGTSTEETPQGYIYTVTMDKSAKGKDADKGILFALNTKTEEIEKLGPAAVGTQTNIQSLDADPTGRYLYYIPGAHGGSEKDGTPVVQFDVQTRQKKVIAFLHPFYKDKYGCTLRGTFSSALDPAGDKLYITWNANRGSKTAWDSCALTVIHIPESERHP